MKLIELRGRWKARDFARTGEEILRMQSPAHLPEVADRHSFSLVDLTPERLQFRALDANGEEIDRFTLTKSRP